MGIEYPTGRVRSVSKLTKRERRVWLAIATVRRKFAPRCQVAIRCRAFPVSRTFPSVGSDAYGNASTKVAREPRDSARGPLVPINVFQRRRNVEVAESSRGFVGIDLHAAYQIPFIFRAVLFQLPWTGNREIRAASPGFSRSHFVERPLASSVAYASRNEKRSLKRAAAGGSRRPPRVLIKTKRRIKIPRPRRSLGKFVISR